ncbi:MAG: HNH endonuclease family protein [Propionibacteriaceae bacterium]|nr:HNH endonuclease family protein [Propionibacteriaceae bacterium]
MERILGGLLVIVVVGAIGHGIWLALQDADPAPEPTVVSETPTPMTAPPPTAEPATATPEAPTPTNEPHPATAVLAQLPIKERDPLAGYSRSRFGDRWVDVDGNGCDQRNDVLGRDLTDVEYRPGTRDCVVVTGMLADPFTGNTIAFTRGDVTSAEVQIDHVVALADAWQKGAQELDFETRQEFANDPLNLLAVDGPTNFLKGHRDAASWLPPNEAFHCEYVATQVAVKAKYRLWVTQTEHKAMVEVLSSCGP